MANHKKAFTLIEVMVAVMIISVVIMALIKMYGDNTHLFNSLKKTTKTNQYSSFFISSENYGFENKEVYLDDLLSDFDLEDELRRELKTKKVKIMFQEIKKIDTSEQEKEIDIESNSNMTVEIGKTIIQADDASSSLFRLRVK